MRRRIPSPPRRALLVAAALLTLVAVAGFWLRDSGFFAVEDVAVHGASGPDAPKVEGALKRVARDMTTLHLDKNELLQAVEGYPTVGDIELDRELPNGLTITVLERTPVAVVTVAGRKVPLTADGRLLQGATPAGNLPALAVKHDPGRHLSDERDKKLLALVAAAPNPLRTRTRRAYLGPNGLTLSMEKGPSVYFGTTKDLTAKWSAAARVLADPTAEGARYIDVRVPDRAAAGGLVPITPPGEETGDPPADTQPLPVEEPATEPSG